MLNHFKNALPIIANALSDTLGVQVIMGRSGTPHTDGKAIYLPVIDSDDQKVRDLFLGYVSHESAHVRFSDFQIFGEMTPIEKSFTNKLEDIRIEKAIGEYFPGCAQYLKDMVTTLVGSQYWKEVTDEMPEIGVVESYLLFQLRLNILNQEGILPLAGSAKVQFEARMPKGVQTRMKALMYQVESCTSSRDCLDLSRKIILMLKEEEEKESEKEQQQQQAEQNSQIPDPSQSQTDKNHESDQENEGDQAQNNGQTQDQGHDGGNSDQVEGKLGEDDDSGQQFAQALQSILNAGEGDMMQDMGDMIRDILGQSESYLPSATQPFRSKKFVVHKPANAVEIGNELNRVAGAVNALKYRAQSLLQTQTRARKRHTMSGTKLDVKSLHRSRIDGMVFKKTSEAVKVDTAIAFLIDRSGSMEYTIGLAVDAALATIMAFDRQDVKTAIYAFPYSNKEGEGNAVLKSWSDRPAAAIDALRYLGVDGSTPMAEAMMGACMELNARREARKILVVATDGAPDNHGSAEWVLNLARKSGFEVLSVGIGVDTSRLFGPDWSERIDDISQLPVAMIGMLDDIMLKKAA